MIEIFVDADACPVVKIIEKTASQFNVPVNLFCDTNHILTSDYARVFTTGAGADAVDIALINKCRKNDIVVTQDYGVASLALGKGTKAINQNGMIFTESNIDSLMFSRYLSKKMRMAKAKSHIKGPKKRCRQDDENFEKAFTELIKSQLNFNNT